MAIGTNVSGAVMASGGITTTYGTWAVITKTNATFTNAATIVELRTSLNANIISLNTNAGSGAPVFKVGSRESLTGLNAMLASSWYIIASGKATGLTTARHHIARLDNGTPTWQHSSSVSSAEDGSGTPNNVIFLRTGSDIIWNGPTAIMAFYPKSLSDAEAETLTGGIEAWLSLDPSALWVFDMAVNTTAISDITGGGANQTSNSSVISTLSVPGWNYSQSGIIYPAKQALAQPRGMMLTGLGRA